MHFILWNCHRKIKDFTFGSIDVFAALLDKYIFWVQYIFLLSRCATLFLWVYLGAFFCIWKSRPWTFPSLHGRSQPLCKGLDVNALFVLWKDFFPILWLFLSVFSGSLCHTRLTFQSCWFGHFAQLLFLVLAFCCWRPMKTVYHLSSYILAMTLGMRSRFWFRSQYE